MKLSKISLAVAAVAAIAGGAAFAGQIGSSSVTLATEVIKTDAQILRAPSTVYSFAGDIDARTNAQLLQLQYTLSEGTWAVAAAGSHFTAVNTPVSVPFVANTSLLQVNYTNAGGTGTSTLPVGTLVNAFVAADKKLLVINITIPANAANLLKQPTFTINPVANAAPVVVGTAVNNAGINGLFTLAGTAACPAPDKSNSIAFKHFATHNGQTSTDIMSVANLASEHLRGGATNGAEYLRFVQNHVFEFAGATSPSRTDAATLNQKLVVQAGGVAPNPNVTFNSNWRTAVADGAVGTKVGYLPPTIAAALAPLTHFLGSFTLKQRAQGRDLDYTNIYGDTAANAVFLEVADVVAIAAAAGQVGAVEISNVAASGGVVASMTFPTALPTGTVIRAYGSDGVLVFASAATTAGQTVVTMNNIAPATFNLLANGPTALKVAGLFMYAEFPANLEIPQNSSVTATLTVVKAPAAAAPALDVSEQNISCPATFTGIGGGIKIDLRNYASFASFPTGSTSSIVRLINNSESKTADIFAQMIYSDGTYGPYGLVGSLKPREVLNITNKDLEAKMTTAAPTANPFGASTVYTSVSGAAVVAGPKAGVGDRVRFVSNTGTTLRVQSFIVSGSTILNVSDAQGVDFENTLNNRAPTTDAQPNSQDAINGLARQ